MRECVEEGILQAYFDGELSSEMMQRVATHIAACAECGEAARVVEAESAMFAEAFAPEMALSVPTERLRSRIDAAIADLQPQSSSKTLVEPQGSSSSRLRSWLGGLMAPLSFVPRQQALGFASLIAVAALGLVFAYLSLRPQQQAVLDLASGAKTTDLGSFEAERKPVSDAGQRDQMAPKMVKASAARAGVSDRRRNVGARSKQSEVDVTPQQPNASTELVASVRLLPGEKSYLKAIASLDTAIKASGDNGLRPTLRAEYERNLQVVDEAIAQTRVVAHRNPNDKDAAEFLFSAYQSKVELMNTVAEQAQLATVYR